MDPCTLLIATYDRAHLLDNSLLRLCELSIPDEVIVVDDGSTDNTEQVCEKFKDRLPIRYIYNHQPDWAICSLARNIGFKEAKNDWIVTAEPEMYFITDVIQQFLDKREEYPACVISAGHIYFGGEGNGLEQDLNLESLETAGDYTPPSGQDKAVGWVAPFTALYNRTWVNRVGGWDEEFPGPWGWDDIDLLTRMRITGIGQYIDLDIHALHQWHGPKHRGDVDFKNEHYFVGKGFNGNERLDHPLLVANQGFERGVIRPRA